MKYIRTKDGRILDNSKKEYVCKVLKPYGKAVKYVGKKEFFFETYFITNRVFEFLKTADNIEELCDEFVEYGNRPIVITQANVKRGRMSGKTRIILGAIWTDKGLIYVAKMNEKGELELL